MRKLIVVYLHLLLSVSACNAKHSTQVETVAHGPGAISSISAAGQPRIVIRGSTITVNGKAVWLGATLDSWKAALPGRSRCISNRNSVTICAWDEYGIEIGTDAVETNRAKFVNIEFAFSAPIEGFSRASSSPKYPFRGYLELDGYPITSVTEFRSIRQNSDPKRNLRCGGSECGNPSGGFSEAASLYFQLDSESERGTPLVFSLSCVSTESCTALIPNRK